MGGSESEGKAPGAPRAYLPTVLTSFIGRERERGEVAALLASSRLLTFTGSAGCGKTRLALSAAAGAAPAFPGGAYWVDLARLADASLVHRTVAKTLRVPVPADRSPLEALSEALAGARLLLVLDNCEHVLDACAELAAALVGAPKGRILATSLWPLGVPGEVVYPVAPLALPPAGTSGAESAGYDAVALFEERARAVLPPFALTEANTAAVIDICRRLDGIPLAIELACARVNVLTLDEIAARLDNRLALLSAVFPITHSRHLTMRAAIAWSYDLLDPPEQTLLRRLSVFAGGCSLSNIEAVCPGNGVEPGQVLDLLTSLVNKSLVVSRTLQRGEARFSLLETIRQYGQEKLKAAGEWEPMRDRHRQRYMQLAEETATKLTGQYEHLWLDWLEGEHDNIRAALAWSLESNHIEAGLRIANSLYQFWTIRDYVVEGLAWTEQLLERAGEDVALIVRVNALAYASLLAGFRGNRTAQIRYGQEAASLAEAAGDAGKPALGWALAGQFWAAWAAGDFQTTFDLMKRAIQIHREVEDTYQLGMALTLSSFPAMTLGLFEEAQALMDEGLPLLRQVGNPYRLAMALNYAGDLARCKGNYAQAQSAYEECIAILRGLDAVRDLASALHNLGHTCLHLRDVERAHALLSESLSIQQALRNTPGVAECLIGYAALAVARGLPGAGARLLAAAVSIGGERVATAWAATRMEYEHTLSLICTGLTDSNFEAEQVAGRAFSLAQAVDYARNLPLAAIPTAQNKLGDLTTREREIAALIARGRSNGEIADELVVSKRTVEKHVANILSKLAFTNRAQIVRWAIEAGLVQSDE